MIVLKTETVSLQIERYTANDKPACAIDWSAGKVCEFLGVRQFGQQAVCMYDNTRVDYGPTGETGFLEPHSNCKVWK